MIILVPGLQLSCSDDTLVSFRETEAISDKEIRKMRPDWREVPRGDISPCWAGWYVTMNPKGLIAMTRPTYERMGAPQAFVVLWDSVNNRIGLKPAALTTRNAYPVRVHSSLGGKKLNVNRLIKDARISLPQTVRFYDADTDEDGVLILDLRTAKVSPRALGHWTKKSIGNKQ